MNFSSDNWAGVHPVISAHLSAQAGGFDPAYGSGEIDKRVGQRFSEIFEREVAVFFVGTGTAANSLSLALSARPGSLSFCHREAHVMEDECGAPEFLTGGSRLHGVDGEDGRMSLDALKAAITRFVPSNVHSGRATAISITQATEAGTVYGLNEISTIGALARENGLSLHMDGARFANALVTLDASPAEMTWKRGVDILSFGGTKNGAGAPRRSSSSTRRRPRRWPSSASALPSFSRNRASSRHSSRPISGMASGWRRPPRQRHGQAPGRTYTRIVESPARLGARRERGLRNHEEGRHDGRAPGGGRLLPLACPHGFAQPMSEAKPSAGW